eukprot:NODE_10375_length_1356_cov_7.475183.p1 GENE.NODE_10375_length_1356_cov_7.475183~~NODE_10375_length_1356_cov_7.475183.p1  ORF type:complete len:431 (-),score=116.00 NODE_10375_length_1356_cov_7.475183:63-1280(-)
MSLAFMPGLLRGISCASRRFGHRIARRRPVVVLTSAWPRLLTMAVFSLHALLPAVSSYSATGMLIGAMLGQSSGAIAGGSIADGDGWGRFHRFSCGALGLFHLCTVFVRHLRSEHPDVEPGRFTLLVSSVIRVLRWLGLVAKVLCGIALWVYATLAADLLVTHAAACLGLVGSIDNSIDSGSSSSFLGVVAWVSSLLGASPEFWQRGSAEAWTFCLSAISVASQQRLVELLGQREVLLRLIGAERVVASSLCLLLRGVAVACGPSRGMNPLAEITAFLDSVAPPPIFCVLVVALRETAPVFGVALLLAPRLVRGAGAGAAWPFLAGLALGGHGAHVLLRIWYSNRADLESSALRLALLVPGSVSTQAKGLLRGMLVGARTRAVRMMAMGLFSRAGRWFWRSRLGA